MGLVAQFAVYGALPGGDQNRAQGRDVRNVLQDSFDRNDSFVKCDNATFGDPSPGNGKHFAAIVTRDGRNFFFACNEGQSIDFAAAGGEARNSSDLTVKFAIYGALPGGDPRKAQAFDVRTLLQELLSGSDTVTCGNGSFGDPSPGNGKHFAAIVTRDGQDLSFACAEGQNINFRRGGTLV
jgi:hypothetical protein